MNGRIIVNAIETPDGTVLLSVRPHDYRSHTDANGKYYAVDGGTGYLKRAGESDYTELSIVLVDGKMKRVPQTKAP